MPMYCNCLVAEKASSDWMNASGMTAPRLEKGMGRPISSENVGTKSTFPEKTTLVRKACNDVMCFKI